ncbi:hypothetical protein [Mesorhizobium intechi]|uniref:hypothetical protein n=1 Tax=Mesorhizobium intechi TaxID=537601 RepID=UPI00142ED1FF|nr:hypothetical protein [Mesorhizobium intechi]
MNIDPELIDRAARFLSYAGDRRAADLVLAERFQIGREVAKAIIEKIRLRKGGSNADAS